MPKCKKGTKLSFKKSAELKPLIHNILPWFFHLIFMYVKNQLSLSSWFFESHIISPNNQESILIINNLDASDFLKDIFATSFIAFMLCFKSFFSITNAFKVFLLLFTFIFWFEWLCRYFYITSHPLFLFLFEFGF